MPLPMVPSVRSEWQMTVGEQAADDCLPSHVEPALALEPPRRL